MADGTGEPKKQWNEPYRPKTQPTIEKLSSANARDYYNPSVPEVNNQKTKKLTCCPSMELADKMPFPPELNQTNKNSTEAQTPQEPNGENTQRRTITIMTTPYT